MASPAITWRKSSRSQSQSDCVEVAYIEKSGVVRDSKNPGGPVLRGDLSRLFATLKAGNLGS